MKDIKVNLGARVREIAMSQEKADKVTLAITKAYGYQEKIPNPEPQPAEGEEGHDTWTEEIDNPQAKDEFVSEKIKNFLEDHTNAYEINKAKEDAANNLTKFTI